MRNGTIAIMSIQKNTYTLLLRRTIQLPAREQTGGIKGFILVPENTVDITQGAYLVSTYVVRLEAIVANTALMNERSSH